MRRLPLTALALCVFAISTAYVALSTSVVTSTAANNMPSILQQESTPEVPVWTQITMSDPYPIPITPTSSVQGTVTLIGNCCEGTSSFTTAHPNVKFTATSVYGSVKKMRLVQKRTVFDPSPSCAGVEQFTGKPWKNFVSHKAIRIPPEKGNSSNIWTISVQYRDTTGQVSPVTCLHIRVSYVDAT